MEHRYILEKYSGPSTRFTCPSCEKSRSFSRYVDTESGEYVSPNVGRCNREIKCGYHYTPKQYFDENGIKADSPRFIKQKPVNKKPVSSSYISPVIVSESFQDYSTNHLIQFLLSIIDKKVVSILISRYKIGSSTHWKGATVFWQIDLNLKVRTGKVMLYNPKDGHRIKKPFNHITWVHSVLKLKEYNLDQCLYGEHLLRDDHTKPVCIVESEKTAIICSAFLPEYIWLASGGLSNLNSKKLNVLKGRRVIFYPDHGAYDKWSEKADKVSDMIDVQVSTLIEDNISGSQKNSGLDLADFLISNLKSNEGKK